MLGPGIWARNCKKGDPSALMDPLIDSMKSLYLKQLNGLNFYRNLQHLWLEYYDVYRFNCKPTIDVPNSHPTHQMLQFNIFSPDLNPLDFLGHIILSISINNHHTISYQSLALIWHFYAFLLIDFYCVIYIIMSINNLWHFQQLYSTFPSYRHGPSLNTSGEHSDALHGHLGWCVVDRAAAALAGGHG